MPHSHDLCSNYTLVIINCLIINKINGYIEGSNGSKCLTLVSTDESEENNGKYIELWSKIKDLIRSKADNSDDYDEKYLKIKSNSDNDLPLTKTLDLCNMIVGPRSVFHEGNKHYSQVFLDRCLHKL